MTDTDTKKKTIYTPELRKHMSDMAKAVWARRRKDPELMKEISERLRRSASQPRPGAWGVPKTEEHRARISASMKKAWITRRLKRKQKEETQQAQEQASTSNKDEQQ